MGFLIATNRLQKTDPAQRGHSDAVRRTEELDTHSTEEPDNRETTEPSRLGRKREMTTRLPRAAAVTRGHPAAGRASSFYHCATRKANKKGPAEGISGALKSHRV